MPDHADHFVLVGQAVGHGHGLLGFARIVTGHQLDLFAVDPARLVDHIGCRLGTFHVLLTEGCVGARHRPRHANLHISLNKRRNTQRGSYREGQETFLVKRLGHEWCSEFFVEWALQFHFKLSLETFTGKLRASGVPLRFYISKRHGVIVITGVSVPFCRDVQPSGTQRCNQRPERVKPADWTDVSQPSSAPSDICNHARNGSAHLQCVTATTRTNTD